MSIETKRRLLKMDRMLNKQPLVQHRKNASSVRFNRKLLSQHDWLVIGDKGGFCVCCKLFGPAEIKGEFLSKPFTTFSRGKLCEEHAQTKYHRDAVVSAASFLRITDSKQENIQTLVTGKQANLAQRRLRLTAVATSLLFCGKQGIALRAYRMEKVDTKPTTVVNSENHLIVKGGCNKGNLLQLMEFQRDAGDSSLNYILNNKSQYISPQIQNELLSIMYTQIRRDIASKMAGKQFSVIADETTDCSNKEQLCIAVRFVDDDPLPTVKEKFLSFQTMFSLTGSYARFIFDCL